MTFWRRLRTRLFASHLLVITIGALAMLAVGTWLTRSLFDGRVRQMGRGLGLGATTTGQLRAALEDSLDLALVAGLLVAVVAAGAVAIVAGRRLLRPIEDVRAATHRIVRGDYEQAVPLPPEEELEALARDVNMLGSRLADVERRRTRLIGEVAHELRSPLTTINAYMEGLIDGVLEPNEEIFSAVADEASRLQRLSEDLILLSQAEERAIPLQLGQSDLGEVAAVAARRLQPQFEHGQVRLVIEAAPPLPILVDEARVAQVFTNLLGNALAHTSAGGTVTVRCGRDGSDGWVEVADSGHGIDPGHLEQIFERFYRIPDPGRPAGRGIGLSIARGIARAHGGEITADSAGLGLGATFRMTIPLGDRSPRRVR